MWRTEISNVFYALINDQLSILFLLHICCSAKKHGTLYLQVWVKIWFISATSFNSTIFIIYGISSGKLCAEVSSCGTYIHTSRICILKERLLRCYAAAKTVLLNICSHARIRARIISNLYICSWRNSVIKFARSFAYSTFYI